MDKAPMHTPGPWTWRHDEECGHYEIKTSEPDGEIGQVFYVNNKPCPIGEADARLTAAAPDLLAALIDARYQLEEYELAATGESYNDIAINDAIEKATKP